VLKSVSQGALSINNLMLIHNNYDELRWKNMKFYFIRAIENSSRRDLENSAIGAPRKI